MFDGFGATNAGEPPCVEDCEVAVFGAVAPLAAGLDEAGLNALCDRMEAYCAQSCATKESGDT